MIFCLVIFSTSGFLGESRASTTLNLITILSSEFCDRCEDGSVVKVADYKAKEAVA